MSTFFTICRDFFRIFWVFYVVLCAYRPDGSELSRPICLSARQVGGRDRDFESCSKHSSVVTRLISLRYQVLQIATRIAYACRQWLWIRMQKDKRKGRWDGGLRWENEVKKEKKLKRKWKKRKGGRKIGEEHKKEEMTKNRKNIAVVISLCSILSQNWVK